MAQRLQTFVLCAFTLFTVIFAVQPAAGQCGVYFKPGYRAVNKLPPVAGGPWVLTDWTGDGRLDFWSFRANQTTQSRDLVIYPALPTGYWEWDAPIVYTMTVSLQTNFASAVRDFDGDGRIDVLTRIGAFGNRTLRIHRNAGNGTMESMVPTLEGETVSTFVSTIDFLDINSDGRLDWIYSLEDTASGNETLTHSIQNPDGSFGPPTTILVHNPANEFNDSTRLVGDFDGDSKVDIVYRSGGSTGY